MRVKNKIICYFLRSNNEQLEVLVFDHRDYFLIHNPNFKLLDYFEHHVRSDGEDNGMVFCFYWISIKAACEQLTGNFHEKLGEACVLYKKL